MSSTHDVLFYEGSWYMFSNFSALAIEWEGELWFTSEHAYQAAKFPNFADIRQNIQRARSPSEAKEIAHANMHLVSLDWPERKLAVMESILRSKLAQHPLVREKLLKTGNRRIVENSPTDSFWGRGPDWYGANHLGRIWMKLRAELLIEQDMIVDRF